ncbi:MAG: flagellar assembly protein FliW [Planctomycetota bacterium]
MRIETQRFGTLTINPDHLFLFPQGLIGMETLRQWTLIPDEQNESVAWLQSASQADRALALVSPRAFFEDYRVRVSKRDLTTLHMSPGSELFIMTTVAGHVGRLTTNLRAPVLLNLDRRLGIQVVTSDDQPLQKSLPLRMKASSHLLPTIEASHEIRRAA